MGNNHGVEISKSPPCEIISAAPPERRRTGVGDYSWRRLRKVLPIRVIGKKHFILGHDWLEYLSTIEPELSSTNGASNDRQLAESSSD